MLYPTSFLLFAFALAAEDAAKSKLGNLKLTIANGHIVEIYGEVCTHHINDEGLRCLRFCFWLKKLDICDEYWGDNPPLTWRALEHVRGLKNLEELRWYDVPGVSSENLALLRECPNLRRFTVRRASRLSPEMLKVIGSFPKLENLSVHQARFDPGVAKGFEELKHLRALDVFGCKFDEPIIEHLKAIKPLRELVLPAKLPEDDLAKLNQLIGLEVLQLDEKNSSDRTLAIAAQLSELKRLSVNGSDVTDEGIKHVAKLPKLEDLRVGFTRITGQSLRTLQGCQRLKSLDISNNEISPYDLRELRGLRHLTRLELGGVYHDDVIYDLAALKSLEHLDLTYAYLSKDGIKRLQAELTKCKVVGGR